MMDVPQHRRCATRLLRFGRTPVAWLSLLLLATVVAVDAGSKVGVYFIRSPESTIAPLRDEVLFECEQNLDPERLEWRFRPSPVLTQRHTEYIYLNKSDGYNISTAAGISKLRINVGHNSAGDYQCVAWYGAAAVASIPARLTLASIALDAVRAQIDEQPPAADRSWYVQPGNAVLVKCAPVVSNPPAVWSFYKDSKLVPNQLSTGTLILQNVQPSDSGTYTCAAVNSITRNEIQMHHRLTLHVTETARAAPTLLLTGGPATRRFAVRAGAVALLECPGHGNPLPKAVWSRPDASIHRNRTAVLDYGLQIVDIQPGDAGTYVCRLDNGIAPALVHTVQLDVLQAARISAGPADQLAHEGDDVQMDCQVHGTPQPEVYWMINGMDTRTDAHVVRQMNGTRMAVRQVQKRHAGIVQCFARNEVGEVSQLALLEVIPKQIPGIEMDGSEMDGLALEEEDTNGGALAAVAQASKHSAMEHGRNGGGGGGGGGGSGNGFGGGGKAKGHTKLKHIMIPPSSPSVTRLADDKVMVRWSVPTTKAAHLPIQFFKVQFRILGDITKTVQRSIWMTSNEDIPATVNMYEVENLKPDHYYRFRIAAVFSNNDNKLSNVSAKFLLQRRSQLDPIKSNLIAPNLTSVEAISQTAVMLHWNMPTGGVGAGRQPSSPAVDGFYAYYRPASTAGEYSKATVDGMHARRFKIEKLEPGTAYEFKLQSFTAAAASDFLSILTGKTLTPSTPAPFPQDVRTNETLPTKQVKPSYLPLIASLAGAASLLLLSVIMICVCIKRRRSGDGDDDANENKSHPDHIQAEPNGYPSGNNGRSVLQKPSRLNGVVPRINITANPLSGADHGGLSTANGDKNRNVMELRFMPSAASVTNNAVHAPSSPAAANATTPIMSSPNASQQHQHQHLSHQNTPATPSTPPSPHTVIATTPPPVPHHQHPLHGHHGLHHHQHPHLQHHHQLPPQHPNNHHMLRQSPTSPEALRRTLDRSHRNVNAHHSNNGGSQHHYDTVDSGGGGIGGGGSPFSGNNGPPLRRGTMASNGQRHIPGSPRVMRGGVSSELLQNRSPMPQRAAVLAGKRGRLGSRTENMSSGSLNSIEV